jgi:Domain of unknown function DUF29
MATRIKTRTGELYETDFYAWASEQASLLRAGRFHELDMDHLVEEVDDLGGTLYRSVRSRVRTIMEHLLKLEHAAAQEPRAGWHDTILTQRRDLIDDLTPTLGRRLAAEIEQHYARARDTVARSLRRHGEDAAAGALPDRCPYTFEQISGDWLP